MVEKMETEDEKENLIHFENFIDDDTPAPEASIPVPVVQKKTHNYMYQAWFENWNTKNLKIIIQLRWLILL